MADKQTAEAMTFEETSLQSFLPPGVCMHTISAINRSLPADHASNAQVAGFMLGPHGIHALR